MGEKFKRGVVGVSTGHAKDKIVKKFAWGGGQTRPSQWIRNLVRLVTTEEDDNCFKFFQSGLQAGRAEESVADNGCGQIIYKVFFNLMSNSIGLRTILICSSGNSCHNLGKL